MIDHYTDHAANERTYLAWVRTALAFMGFGLLIERFDLLVRSLARVPENTPWARAPDLAAAAGMVLIALGIGVLAIASFRYLRFKKLIASAHTVDFRAVRSDLALVVIVAAIGAFMAAYVAFQILG